MGRKLVRTGRGHPRKLLFIIMLSKEPPEVLQLLLVLLDVVT